MIIAKENAIGIDSIINKAQNKLEKLVSLWETEIDIYPRCYELSKKEGKTIEHFKEGIDYSGNLIHSEKNKLFFVQKRFSQVDKSYRFKSEISLFGIFQISKIDNFKGRNDNELLVDILEVLNTTGLSEEGKDIELVNPFSGFLFNQKQLLRPYFSFRIDLTTTKYSLNEICC
jgi:hypothetical protein